MGEAEVRWQVYVYTCKYMRIREYIRICEYVSILKMYKKKRGTLFWPNVQFVARCKPDDSNVCDKQLPKLTLLV